jgi:hypothetical protein
VEEFSEELFIPILSCVEMRGAGNLAGEDLPTISEDLNPAQLEPHSPQIAGMVAVVEEEQYVPLLVAEAVNLIDDVLALFLHPPNSYNYQTQTLLPLGEFVYAILQL